MDKNKIQKEKKKLNKYKIEIVKEKNQKDNKRRTKKNINITGYKTL